MSSLLSLILTIILLIPSLTEDADSYCPAPDPKSCLSGDNPLLVPKSFSPINSNWHYSRSTHFGITFGGACGFGLYQACGNNIGLTGSNDIICKQFCTNFPDLCYEPPNISYRGNYAAPQGNYYTQHRKNLNDDEDNYLSCGECFEVIKTKNDGSDYDENEEGYTKPIILSIIDSCPCSANPKWCCGSGQDACDIDYFKYGCPIPEDSIHLDLSDVAMARLQTGKPDGAMNDGIVPMRYRRVPCPISGNMFILLQNYGGPYWFALSVVNVNGYGAIAVVEAKNDNGEWVKLVRDPNYVEGHPQERYGMWSVGKDAGCAFNVPVSLRFTDGSGEILEVKDAIKTFDMSENAIDGMYNYIDLGTNFKGVDFDYEDTKM